MATGSAGPRARARGCTSRPWPGLHRSARPAFRHMSLNVFELIADPVRLAIVRQLSGGRSTPIAVIADAAGFHVNTVRSHMSDLEAAGVVTREHMAGDGPGRPQILYRLSSGWRLPSSDMRGLSELLAALAIRLDPAVEEIQELGRAWGRFLNGRPGGDPMASLPRLLEQLGFDAEVDGHEIRLRSCPCPLVSPEAPPADLPPGLRGDRRHRRGRPQAVAGHLEPARPRAAQLHDPIGRKSGSARDHDEALRRRRLTGWSLIDLGRRALPDRPQRDTLRLEGWVG